MFHSVYSELFAFLMGKYCRTMCAKTIACWYFLSVAVYTSACLCKYNECYFIYHYHSLHSVNVYHQ